MNRTQSALIRSTFIRSTLLIAASCATALLAGCSTPPARTIAVDAHVVPNPNSGTPASEAGPEVVVMSTVTVRDASGTVIATPRVLSELDQTASLRMDSTGEPIVLDVVARRAGTRIEVEAILKDINGRTLTTESVRAQDGAAQKPSR